MRSYRKAEPAKGRSDGRGGPRAAADRHDRRPADLAALQRALGNRALGAREGAAGGPGPTDRALGRLRGDAGAPLDHELRAPLEAGLGVDLSAVRIHVGGSAADAACLLNARAFTLGNHVVFGAGQYAPASEAGRRLLAHELIHTVQQSRGGSGAPPLSPSSRGEREVQRAADELVRGGSPRLPRPTGVGLARQFRSLNVDALSFDELQQEREMVRERLTGPDYAFREADETYYGEILRALTSSLGLPALTSEQRTELRSVTRTRISLAYTAFVSASRSVANAINEAINQEAEMAMLLVDVAMGFLSPALARGIARAANNLPANASNVAYRVALAALDEGRTAEIFNAATKVGTTFAKQNAVRLFGETDVDEFLVALRVQYQGAFQKISDELPLLTDYELGVTTASFDSSVTNEHTYRDAINKLVERFRRQVLPIGETTGTASRVYARVGRQLAYWVVDASGTRRLALIERSVSSTRGTLRYRFITWISREFHERALARTRQFNRGRVETLAERDVVFP
jgi:hypothetical protein